MMYQFQGYAVLVPEGGGGVIRGVDMNMNI